MRTMGTSLPIESHDSGGANGAHLKVPHDPARRPDEVAELSQASEPHSYLPKGSEIIGTLFFEGPVAIDGHVEGDITGGDKIAVGENGLVTADKITADSVVIGGAVKVNKVTGRRVVILATARIAGECHIAAGVLSMHEGAQFEGNVLAGECRDFSHAELLRTRRAPRF
jgi:cytoskeletal protein CcmA (bactofilin family)